MSPLVPLVSLVATPPQAMGSEVASSQPGMGAAFVDMMAQWMKAQGQGAQTSTDPTSGLQAPMPPPTAWEQQLIAPEDTESATLTADPNLAVVTPDLLIVTTGQGAWQAMAAETKLSTKALTPASDPGSTTAPSIMDLDAVDAKAPSAKSAEPNLPVSGAPTPDVAPEDQAARPVETDLRQGLPSITASAPETPRHGFSLQQVTEATATPYTPPPAIAAMASTLSQAAVDQISQVSVALQKRLSEGTTKFQIELKPADLGRIDVALTITAAGKVTAHLAFDTPITATTFAARESELRQHLMATGLKLDGDALTFSARPAETQTATSSPSGFFASGDTHQGQTPRQTPRQASNRASSHEATEADLDTALNQLRHRPAASRLALDLTV